MNIGVLAPLTRPGWVEAGRHLLAGLDLAVRDVNDAGGILGRPLELVVRDTAADPERAVAAVDELAGLGVAAVAGQYHSVVARAAAARPTRSACRSCVRRALLLLVGHPEPAVPIVKAVRGDRRLSGIMIGAPAGQPEFAEWATSLGADGAGIPFLRYLPAHLGRLGARVAVALRERLAEAPSFVAFEGYDTVAVLADVLRSRGMDWARVAVDGTRGRITFSRLPGIGVWQWAWAPVQVVDRGSRRPRSLSRPALRLSEYRSG